MVDETGSIEEVKDVEKGEDGVVRRWLMELDKASETEKEWRKDGRKALAIYGLAEYHNDDFGKQKDTFNILWANTETVRPALYNSQPRPDIRRRYKDKDPIGKAVAEVCERAVSYTLEAQDIDSRMMDAVNDMLLPGRAVTRVRYVPSFTQEDGEETAEVAFEEVTYESVQWDDFRRGPGKNWQQVPWIAFRHKLTKDQIKDRFPEFVDKVGYDATVYSDANEQDESQPDKQLFKRCLVWEIWNKDTRKVIFVAPSYKDKALAEKDDPLNLQGFWPIPRPMYAVSNSTTLVPATRYSMYETLAKELEDVTNRIRKILDGLRLRGIYDSRISEIEKLFDSYDNNFIPAENIAALLEAGGLEKAIFTLPVEMYAEVLARLYEYRQGLIHSIYEITGISDIIRGATNPNETLGAQELKANFGSQRLQEEQREVQRYVRDLVRITVEILCEQFDNQTLQLMTNLNFPTMEQKQQVQMQMQQQQAMAQQQAQQAMLIAQQTGQQPPPPQPPPAPDPNTQKMLETPTWEEIRQVMSNDLMRDYRIDIETDSTIQAQQQEDQKNITELLGGINQFMQGVAEPIASGVMTVETAKTMLMAAVRRFKLGREVEDALEDIEAPQSQGIPQEEVQKQMADVQKQAEQAVKQAQTQAQQMASKAQQEAEAKAAEASQKAMAQASEAEQRGKQQVADIQKQYQSDMEAEKTRNKLEKDALSLDYKRKIFDLEKQLAAIETKYSDELGTVQETIRKEKQAEEDKQRQSEVEEKRTQVEDDIKQKMQAVTVSTGPMEKLINQVKAMFAAKDKQLSELEKKVQALPTKEEVLKAQREQDRGVGEVIKELSKPRKVKKNKAGEIIGIE